MANISQISIGSNTFDIKDTTARNGLANKQDTLTAGQNISIEKNIQTGETVISATGGGTEVKLADVSGAAVTTNKSTVLLTWTDPNDVIISDVTLAEWSGTKVVRKVGSAPANLSDGTLIADSKIRNAHSLTALADNTVEYGTMYYYRFFPYTITGLTTTGSAVSVTPARTKITTAPSQLGTLTYNGNEQTAVWSNYDPDKMTVTGNTATNAGTYTAQFTPKADYCWDDDSTTAKAVQWTIDKATGTVTLSESAIALNATTTYADVTITTNSDGALSVASSDPTVAAVGSIVGGVFRVTADEAGTATVTVTLAATANYTGATATASVAVKYTTIYGAEWDGTSSPAWTRTDTAELFTDPNPAVNNGNGSSPFDTIMPWSGMVREERTGGTMVKIPKYWYKWTRTGTKMKLQITANEEEATENNFLVSPAHADRGDGKGERDYVYVGAYHCASDYKSKTGVKPVGSKTRATFRSNIHNLGSTIWQYDYAMYWTIMMLYLVEYADWNSQAVIGYGCGNNSSVENNGLCDNMTYHTGTNAASRTTYGHVRYRYIEGLWDNIMDWCDGIYFSSSNVYCIKNPANFSDSSGGTLVGTRATSSGYISGWTNPSASGYEYALYPNAVSGSESTYVCDYCYYGSSGVVLLVGGYYFQYQYYGAFYLYGNYGASYSNASIGSRIQELP